MPKSTVNHHKKFGSSVWEFQESETNNRKKMTIKPFKIRIALSKIEKWLYIFIKDDHHKQGGKLMKKEQKCEKLEESAFEILVFLVIIEFFEC